MWNPFKFHVKWDYKPLIWWILILIWYPCLIYSICLDMKLCESLILIQHYKYLVNLCIDKNNALKERNKRHTDIHLYVRINSCSYRRCGVVLYSQTPWTWSDCKSMFTTYSLDVITVCSLRGISKAYFPFWRVASTFILH